MSLSSHEIDVTIETLKEAFVCNQEIEFEFDGVQYFAQPCSNRPHPVCYRIWDVTTHKCIFQGGVEDLFDFEFSCGKTLAKNFTEFTIQYIL